MGGERDGLQGNAFLHATITRKGDDMAVKNLVGLGVEASGGHLAGNRKAHGVGDTLAERAGGALYARGLVEFGMPGSLGMELAETLYLVEGQVVAAEMKPRVDKHRAMTGGEHEAVTVQPARGAGAVRKRATVEGGTDFGGAERQAEMSGIAFVHRIHGEATGLVGG